MKGPKENDLYFEEIGEQFNCWMSPYDVQQRVKLIKKLLPEDVSDASCLEIGCGTGKISEIIAPLVKDLLVVDISEALAKSVGTRLGVDWMAQDACKLTLPHDTFDLIISSECIEHTADPRKALVNMTKALKEGGKLVVTSPNKLWYPVLWFAQVSGIRNFTGNEDWLFPFEAAKVLKKNTICDLQMSGCHLFPWQLPLAKYVLPFFDRFDRFLYPFMINYGILGRKSSQMQQ